MADGSYSFITGPEVRPYSPSSPRAMDLLGSVTGLELATCVPYIRIRQLDPSSRRPVAGDGIMLELLSPPDFGDPLARSERPNVSLESLSVKSQMSWGTTTFTGVELSFVVHRPEAVFSTTSPSPWRALIQEGTVHQLDFGWSGETRNELFNGVGYFDEASGFFTPSRRSLIFTVPKYNFSVTNEGAMRFTLSAMEAYDVGFRQVRVDITRLVPLPQSVLAGGPAITALPVESLIRGLDAEQLQSSLDRTLSELDSRVVRRGKSDFHRFGDVFDALVVPQLTRFMPLFGYSRVAVYVGNFNPRAGSSNRDYGSVEMGGRSIAEFLVPKRLLRDTVTRFVTLGEKMNVDNFVSTLIGTMNAAPWLGAQREGANVRIPSVKYRVFSREDRDGQQELVVTLFDEHESSAPFDAVQDALAVGLRSHAEVIRTVRERNVPVVSFGHASTLVKDNSFEVIQDELMRSILVEKSVPERDLRTSIAPRPDPNGRSGGARPRDLIQLGHTQGSITFHGNFVFDMFAVAWLDFFEASEFSGLFTVRGVQHDLRPGSFMTTVEVISAGDPLNTRRRLQPAT